MGTGRFVIEFRLKLKQYRMQFWFLAIFWLIGIIVFSAFYAEEGFWAILMYSLVIRSPPEASDYANFFALIWPILLEVVLIGFVMGALFEKYNPVITSKMLAQNLYNHTVIIGYYHLGERIVEYCVNNKKPFCVMEDDAEFVEDIISAGHPVIVGDATEETNLKFANIKEAKEIFICVNDYRTEIICAEKIRKMNKTCKIYTQVFQKHVRDYLRQEPLNTFSFSTSKWIMDKIKGWLKGKTGHALVVGRDNLAHRIAHQISLQEDRTVYFFNDEAEGIRFEERSNLKIINKLCCFLSDFREVVDLTKVTQLFICWKRDTEFDESLYLTSKFHLRYPDVEVYVRVFDEELADLVARYNAKTFSTSGYAFEMLQQNVTPDSAIYPKKQKK
ncbi:MAG: hypothetical protein GF364_20265 [Candidatus Lokiarchaeota archaeon]|nr:hypothetical protein [Candidatus Lokiarchaeota archaeon]